MNKRFAFLLFFIALNIFVKGFSTENIDSEISLKKEMEDKIEELHSGNSFAYLHLGLSEEELQMLNSFKIESGNFYDLFGDSDRLKEELPPFLRSLGNNDEKLIQTITEIILKTARSLRVAIDKDSAWISVRAFLPTESYNIPAGIVMESIFLPIMNSSLNLQLY